MNVLSLFDGMSCGRIALERAGIPVTNYFASEIDKHAIQVSKANWPDIQHIGDVSNVNIIDPTEIDLLIAGSPCQGFSFAGKQLNFDDSRSKLFFEFVRLKNQSQPRYFLLENVPMLKVHQDVITNILGVEPVCINSNLLSAQNRKRIYWTNINFGLPIDLGIYLKDILESDFDEVLLKSKSNTVRSGGRMSNDRHEWDNIYKNINPIISNLTSREYSISIAKNGNIRPHRNDFKKSGISEVGTICEVQNKSVTHIASHVPKVYNAHPFKCRRLTPLECERLQTVPDNYTSSVTDTQRYKMLGNGWTVDVIAHIFKNIPK